MKDFFNELFEYNHHYNQKLAEVLFNHEEKLTAKSTNLFSHLISAHQIWNSRILAHQKPFEVWQIHSVSEYKRIDKANFENSLSILCTYGLTTVLSYKTSKGVPFESTVQNVLFHIINHSTYHRAQIVTELKSVGIEPLSTDWILYKR